MTTSNSSSNTASGWPRWSPSWPLALWWILRSASSSFPSALLLSSPSLNASQSRDWSGWLRWGLVSGFALWLGATALVGDRLELSGRSALATKVFPWNRYIRTRTGYNAIQRGGPVSDIEQALATDPWSADLTYGLGLIYLLHADPRANDMATRFLQIAPNSPIVKRAK